MQALFTTNTWSAGAKTMSTSSVCWHWVSSRTYILECLGNFAAVTHRRRKCIDQRRCPDAAPDENDIQREAREHRRRHRGLSRHSTPQSLGESRGEPRRGRLERHCGGIANSANSPQTMSGKSLRLSFKGDKVRPMANAAQAEKDQVEWGRKSQQAQLCPG